MNETLTTITTILIVAGVIFAVVSVVYGIFRKFTQMSWFSYQITLVFLLVALLRALPANTSDAARFWLGLVYLIGGTILIVGGGQLLRRAMLRKRMPAHPAWRFLNRFLGAVTALWDYIVIALVLGCTVLSFFQNVYDPVGFGPFFESGIWKNFLGHHALDFLLVALLVLAMRGGWRVGFGRVFIIVLMLALSLGSVALGIYLAVGVPFFADLSRSLGAGMGGAVGVIVGTAIVAFILFLIFFVISCVLGFFMVKLMRLIRYDYFWGTLDACFGAALSLIVSLAVVIGLYVAVAAVSGGVLTQLFEQISSMLGENGQAIGPMGDMIAGLQDIFKGVGVWLESAPLSNAFFHNPIIVVRFV